MKLFVYIVSLLCLVSLVFANPILQRSKRLIAVDRADYQSPLSIGGGLGKLTGPGDSLFSISGLQFSSLTARLQAMPTRCCQDTRSETSTWSEETAVKMTTDDAQTTPLNQYPGLWLFKLCLSPVRCFVPILVLLKQQKSNFLVFLWRLLAKNGSVLPLDCQLYLFVVVVVELFI